jgi:hypothetical protein
VLGTAILMVALIVGLFCALPGRSRTGSPPDSTMTWLGGVLVAVSLVLALTVALPPSLLTAS